MRSLRVGEEVWWHDRFPSGPADPSRLGTVDRCYSEGTVGIPLGRDGLKVFVPGDRVHRAADNYPVAGCPYCRQDSPMTATVEPGRVGASQEPARPGSV